MGPTHVPQLAQAQLLLCKGGWYSPDCRKLAGRLTQASIIVHSAGSLRKRTRGSAKVDCCSPDCWKLAGRSTWALGYITAGLCQLFSLLYNYVRGNVKVDWCPPDCWKLAGRSTWASGFITAVLCQLIIWMGGGRCTIWLMFLGQLEIGWEVQMYIISITGYEYPELYALNRALLFMQHPTVNW